ncbi:UNVERIFIED_CONTAM: protein HEADING DATE 3A [Sesamum calycinum]|uniref:Protein HEADING DATE 3A n=1 Tax=Sesamum calycinum TaxID=2727403 RepID=A0AAW2NUH2_9LAMI
MPRQIRDPLEVGRVVGDVVDPFTSSTSLWISYGGRVVANGCDLRSPQVVSQPRVDIGVMIFELSILWLVIDIPGSTGTSFGTEVVCYESPRPTMGIHRLVFLLFRQLGRQTVYAPGWRQNFITRDFAEVYNLGSPVAAVYYNCQRENGSGGRRS